MDADTGADADSRFNYTFIVHTFADFEILKRSILPTILLSVNAIVTSHSGFIKVCRANLCIME